MFGHFEEPTDPRRSIQQSLRMLRQLLNQQLKEGN